MVGIFFTANNVFSAPIISGVSGNIADGQSITISGSNFSIKPSLTPHAWDDFDDGADMTQWNSIHSLVANDVVAEQRTGSVGNMKENIQLSEWGNVTASDRDVTTDTWYGSIWIKFEAGLLDTGTAGYPCASPCNTNCPNTNIKFFRIFPEGASNYPNHYFNFVVRGGSPGTSRVAWWSESPGEGYEVDYDWPTLFNDGNWHNVEVSFKHASGPDANDGIVMGWVDGTRVLHSDTYDSYDASPGKPAMHMSTFGWRCVTCQQEGSAWYWQDDTYVDISLARVMIGDKSDFNNCTQHELQPIVTAWSDTSINVTIKRGSLAPCETHYLFVVDENGVLSAGKEIKIVTAAGEAPCPPTAVEIK